MSFSNERTKNKTTHVIHGASWNYLLTYFKVAYLTILLLLAAVIELIALIVNSAETENQ